jgi:acetolactate decarboxylase
VAPVADAMLTPFATVTFFKPDHSLALTDSLDFHGIEQRLNQVLPDKNAFYAIKIEGEFVTVKARSVPRQQPPYPPLSEAAKRQAVFEFHDVRGTLVGFRVPEYAGKLNVPGYHFHFLTADRHAGGHVLACRIRSAKVDIDHCDRFLMILPQRGAFATSDIAKPRDEELGTVEKGEP